MDNNNYSNNYNNNYGNGYNNNYNNSYNNNYNNSYNNNYNNSYNNNYNNGYNNNYNNANNTYNNGYNTNYNNNPNNNYYNGYPNNNVVNDTYRNQNYNAGAYDDRPFVLNPGHLQSLYVPEVIAKSFLFMFAALLITAFAAFTTDIDFAVSLLTGGIFYILLCAELVSNYAISKNKAILAAILYVIYSYLTGVTMSVIFMAYTTASITSIFLVTAVVFAIMAVYGIITDTDLSSVGNICFMGLIGIIIAGVVNLFLGSSVADTIICCIGVLCFVGLTAYDTQKIKQRVSIATDETVFTLALYGGFELYLDFVNLFLKLLRLFGKRR